MLKVQAKSPVEDINDVLPPEQDIGEELEDGLLKSTLTTPTQMLDDGPPSDDPVSSVNKRLSRGLFDWRISKKEVSESVEELLALPDCDLEAALVELAANGKLKKIFDKIPKGLSQDKLFKLYQHAPPEILKAQVYDLLTLGVFDWAVKAGEVDQVLDMLALLPEETRTELASAENGRFLDTLMAANERHEAKEAAAKAKAEEKAAKKALKLKKKEARAKKKSDRKAGIEPEADTAEKGPNFIQKVGNVTKGVGIGTFMLGRAIVTGGNVDLDHAEAMMGGDIAGLKIDKNAGEKGKNNQLDLDFKLREGLISIDMPQLGLESVNSDGVSSGSSSISGFHGDLKWRTEEDNDAYVDLKIESVNLGDTTVEMGGDTYVIKGLSIDNVHLHGTDNLISSAKPMKSGEGTKLALNYVARMVKLNLPAIKGVVASDYNKPETLVERLAKQFGADTDVDFKVGGLKLGEVTKNGEVLAADIDVKGFGVTVKDVSMKDRLVAERDAIEADENCDAASLGRLEEINGLLDQWDSLEGRLMVLTSKSESGDLSRKEQNELIELRNQIRVSALTLDIASVHTGKVDYDGMGVDGLDAKTIHASVTGGDLESMRRSKTDEQQLDALLGKKHSWAVEAEAVPGMMVSGGAAEFDVKKGRYSDVKDASATPAAAPSLIPYDPAYEPGMIDIDPFLNAPGPGMAFDRFRNPSPTTPLPEPDHLGTAEVSAKGTGLSFGYNADTGDTNLGAKTFGIEGLDFDGEGEYDAFDTKLANASGTNLDFNYNMNSGAMDGKANDLVGGGLSMPNYDTKVKSFAAGEASFSYGADGAVHAEGDDITVGGVDYRAPGMETTVQSGAADHFSFDMYDEVDKDGTKRSVMKGDATNADIKGLGYEPMATEIKSANADYLDFNLTEEVTKAGVKTSSTTASGTGVTATGVDYGVKGMETHVGNVETDDFTFGMKDVENGNVTTSTMDVSGNGLIMDDLNYKPNAVGIDKTTAETYRFGSKDVATTTSEINDKGQKVDKVEKVSTMSGGATGARVEGVGYGDDVSVKSADLATANFAMDADESIRLDGTGIKARGIDAAGATVDYVGANKADMTYANDKLDASADGYDVRGVTYGEGASRIGVGAAGGGHVDFGYSEAGMTIDTPDAIVKDFTYGDTDNGKGTRVDHIRAKGVNASISDELTSVETTSVSAKGVDSKDFGLTVSSANTKGLNAKIANGNTAIGADYFNAGTIGYTDPASKTPDKQDLTVGGARGTGLKVNIGEDGTKVHTDQVSTGVIQYGDAATDNVAATVNGAKASNLDFSYGSDGAMGLSADKLSTGKISNKYNTRNTEVQSLSTSALKAENITVGGEGVFGGSVDVGGLNAEGISSTDGDMTTILNSVAAKNVYAVGNNAGKLNAGAGSVDAKGLYHTQGEDTWVTADEINATGVDAALSGLNDEIKLDGFKTDTVDGTNVQGTLDIWKMLDKPSDATATTPASNAGDFDAEALGGASGTIKATIPISVDLGWAGSIDIDARATMVAKNGAVDLKNVNVDFVSMNAMGWIANRLVDAVNPDLTIDGSGNLEIYFEIPIPLCPDIPIWVNIFDGSDMGMSGGWISPHVIKLEPLVEGLMKPSDTPPKTKTIMVPIYDEPMMAEENLDPEYPAMKPMENDATYVDPAYAGQTMYMEVPDTSTTTESTEQTMKEISPYVNTKRASIELIGIKLGDGRIGNNDGNADLYGSDKGANKFDGKFTAGKGGTVNSDLVQARDINVGSDINIGDAKVRDLDVVAEPLVNGNNGLNKSQLAQATVGGVEIKDIAVGDQNAVGRNKFNKTKKK